MSGNDGGPSIFSPLPFFPLPQPHETVYSLIARFLHRYSVEKVELAKLILGATPKYLSSLKNIQALSDLMPDGHPWQHPKNIIARHTAINYLTYFHSKESRAKLWNAISIGDFTSWLPLGFYMLGSARYCPVCAKEQIKAYGFSWFLVEHQLPGVVLCWKHGGQLFEGCRKCGSYPIKELPMMPGQCLCVNGITPQPVYEIEAETLHFFKWIASESADLLSRKSLAGKVLDKVLTDFSLFSGKEEKKRFERDVTKKLAQCFGEITHENLRLGDSVLDKLRYLTIRQRIPRLWDDLSYEFFQCGSRQQHPLKVLLIVRALSGGIKDSKNEIHAI
ncbi:TniQ family protein [Desulfuromonas acetoxidans]|uniref:TniQ family protein n=1 Tax=Desulfuromonas acetoxidans TaxID=891 RepID=UPI00292E266A|nr:TniQ family protein [Desulfuromonas acetoxidans]